MWAARYTGGDSAGNEAIVGSLRDIREQILKAGFYYLFSDNPNVQYGTVRLRKTSRRVDRVYAIMQIYDIRVGKSARRGPELEELVDEFAGAIHAHSAILGQLFLHTTPPERGKTWRITRNRAFERTNIGLLLYPRGQGDDGDWQSAPRGLLMGRV